MLSRAEVPGPGQESVWDYPRPPRVDPSSKHVTIEIAGVVLADSQRALRVLETSHPPGWYIPLTDIAQQYLVASDRSTFCEYKGGARYYSVVVGERRETDAGWYYPSPSRGFEALMDHVAFYPGRMDRCTVDGEVVVPQDGGFYGGWITSDVVGPFKGAPNTRGW